MSEIAESDVKRLICMSQIADFNVCYYLVQCVLENGGLFYGVLLEKQGEGGGVMDSASVRGVSENEGDVLGVIKMLADMYVTPVGLYDVIDQIQSQIMDLG